MRCRFRAPARTSPLQHARDNSNLAYGSRVVQARREEIQSLLGMVTSGSGSICAPETLLSAAADENARSDQVWALLENVCAHVHAASKSLATAEEPAGLPGSRHALDVDSKCTVKTVNKWLAELEERLYKMHSICQSLCRPGQDGHIAIERPPLILSDWCQRERIQKAPRATVPEIHEALCLQAQQQRRGGEFEDDDEDAGDDAKREAEKNRSPFQRKPVRFTHARYAKTKHIAPPIVDANLLAGK